MNVLFVTYGVPYPPHGGAPLRDWNLLRVLAGEHQVTCACVLEQPPDRRALAVLEQNGISAYGFVLPHRFQPGALARHLAARLPLATYAFYSAAAFEQIRALTTRRAFDIAQIEHSFLTPYRHALAPNFRGKTILDLHNIGALQYRRMLNLKLSPRERAQFWFKARLMRDWEIHAAAQFDRVLTVSKSEADWLTAQLPTLRPIVVENGVDITQCAFTNPNASHTLLFVGTLGYLPNADAGRWFCDEIFPRITNALPDAEFEMVGRAPRRTVQALSRRKNVRVTANVEDLQPHYENAGVVVVPLRAGGGTRLKILEAMAYGRAVVSTRVGAEGLDVRDGENIFLADTPREFAERVIFLLRNLAARERVARNARRWVETRYTWARAGAQLRQTYRELAV
jgi:glycosyltransferase involved in cell wall biosynthesis